MLHLFFNTLIICAAIYVAFLIAILLRVAWEFIETWRLSYKYMKGRQQNQKNSKEIK